MRAGEVTDDVGQLLLFCAQRAIAVAPGGDQPIAETSGGLRCRQFGEARIATERPQLLTPCVRIIDQLLVRGEENGFSGQHLEQDPGVLGPDLQTLAVGQPVTGRNAPRDRLGPPEGNEDRARADDLLPEGKENREPRFLPHPSARVAEGIPEHLRRARNFVVELSQRMLVEPGRRLPPVASQPGEQPIVERRQCVALPIPVRVAGVGRDDVSRMRKAEPERRADPRRDGRATSADAHHI